jgi:hypothetical protein
MIFRILASVPLVGTTKSARSNRTPRLGYVFMMRGG